MTILAKFRGNHGVALSTAPEYEGSAVTDEAPGRKPAVPKPAAQPERLSEISLEVAEARDLELDQEIARRRERKSAAQRSYEAAKEAHQAELVAGRSPDWGQVKAAQSALEREETELEGFERAKAAHRPILLRSRIDGLMAERVRHLAAKAAQKQEELACEAAFKEAENRWNAAIHAGTVLSEQASVCERAANDLRRELKLP